MHKHIELIKTLRAKQAALRRISRPAAATIIGQLVDIVKSPDTDDHTARDRIACIRIEWTDGEGLT